MSADRNRYRSLLDAPGVVFEAGAFDPFSARIAQYAGFPAVGFNLRDVSAALGLTPETIEIEDLVRLARYATSSLTVPLRLDIGSGFGSLKRLTRATREAEIAGVGAITIDDTDYGADASQAEQGKGAIATDIAAQRIETVRNARRDPSMVIAMRSDVLRSGDVKEAIRRCKLYYQAGADICLVSSSSVEQTRALAAEVGKPLGIIVGVGGQKSPIDANTGFKLVAYEQSALLTATHTFVELCRTIKKTGLSGDQAQLQEARQFAEDAIGLTEMYEIEERTVERVQ